MATVEQLLADPDFRALPPKHREELLTDALAMESQTPSAPSAQKAGLNPAYNAPMQPQRTTFHEGGSVLSNTPATMGERLQRGLLSEMGGTRTADVPQGPDPARTIPMSGGMTSPVPMGPGAAFQSYLKGEQQGAQAVAPMVGSAVGSVIGGPAGDIAGTAAGYAFNVLTKQEPFSLKGALMSVGPSALFNAPGAAMQIAVPLAKSSQAGRMASRDVLNKNIRGYNTQQTATQSVADNAAAVFNANAQADLEHSQALQAQFLAREQARMQSDLAAYNAVVAQQTAEKARQAEVLRGMQMAQRQGNVGKIQQYAESMLPVVPEKAAVDQLYTDAQDIAVRYTKPIVLPELQAVRKLFLAEAASARVTLGNTPLSENLETLGHAGGTLNARTAQLLPAFQAGGSAAKGMTLQDIQTGLSLAKGHIASLKRSTGEYANTQRLTYTRLVEAMEDGLEKLADNDALPADFRSTLKLANQQYRQRKTHEELTTFVTENLVRAGPDGQGQFSPQVALRALENKDNQQLKTYLQQTTLPDSPDTLYDRLTSTLQAMAKLDHTALEQQRILARTGGMTLPDKPAMPATSATGLAPQAPQRTAPQMQLLTENMEKIRGGPLATMADYALRGATGAGALYQTLGMMQRGGMPSGGELGAVLGLSAAALGAISALLMTDTGQKTLLALVQQSGPRLTPAMIGLVSQAARPLLAPAAEPQRP